ncbi:uncharacterized protein DNG_08133 [Cephalotrichum gorgonifer]|uniref:P-loop containing nucleoside triphosphate hydrolase protein n=1 Tax=Cephalotrichum gorgonifer TaxID=2041049 RepID=A0AAE8SY22_9PEZI|nr:uncharacterized protein DNG_08133 [Cephalotrichum gorgonifer]
MSSTDSSSSSGSSVSGSSTRSDSEDEDDLELRRHLTYLTRSPDDDNRKETALSPVFTAPVHLYAKEVNARDRLSRGKRHRDPLFPQHSLLGREIGTETDARGGDTRVFYNVSAPCSIFICGSQGSGKSHTLSCVLEGCLIPSDVSKLSTPLAGLVFHYDTFISETGGAPCEAAFLASNSKATVRILCAPTNVRVIQETYKNIPQVSVEMLLLREEDLNTKRMMDLMAVGEGNVPLYVHVIQRILRDMRIAQQQGDHIQPFKYAEFRRRIGQEDLTDHQLVPLNQRLDTLESFMVKKGAGGVLGDKKRRAGTDWQPVPGQLTIVDLSCPCVTADMACSLFNICLSLFLEKGQSGSNPLSADVPPPIGRVVALDEAHKYMTSDDSGAAGTLTNSLLATIRLQRHLGLRVVISTQEPTVSPKLLDLCSVTIVHRFSSPAWMKALRDHLAGGVEERRSGKKAGVEVADHFDRIVKLRVGEALMFAPNAAVSLAVEKGAGASGGVADMRVRRLGHEVLKILIRERITTDGGGTIMAT